MWGSAKKQVRNLSNYVLSVLFAIKLELQENVLERYPSVGQAYHPDSSLDDVMVETIDEGVSFIFQEDLRMGIESLLESSQVANADSYM